MEKALKVMDTLDTILGIAALTLALITMAGWLVQITQGYLLTEDLTFLVVSAVIVTIIAIVNIIAEYVISKKLESN